MKPNTIKSKLFLFLLIGMLLAACSSSPPSKPAFLQREIAFIQRNEQGAYIYTIDDTGKNLKQLATINVHRIPIKWSPDGEYIAFTSIALVVCQTWIDG